MSHAPVVAAASTSAAVWNGTKPFAGSSAGPRCQPGSTIPAANSASSKSMSAMFLLCQIVEGGNFGVSPLVGQLRQQSEMN
jgi:hypothetical protein